MRNQDKKPLIVSTKGLPISACISIYLLTFTLYENIVFITEKWVKSFMRHTEKNSDESRGYFAASRNLFSKILFT
ncbi:hypothetical protein BAMY6614_05605 [Bacillus amyloliquefaciens UMAF6614]|nr:hypothetical protein BAMY6614_05605 [Bacillus amyloliquefaciens UMAF6614]AWM46674.1 hypothetical protein DDT09_01795 [Bacillus amyloliquefaciens]